MYAEALAANQPMLTSIRAAHASGMPIYAECGGLIYLCRSVAGADGGSYPMVGLVPACVEMHNRRIALGYRTVRARRSTVLLEEGQVARGHEFHWSDLETPLDGTEAVYEVLENGRREGFWQNNLLASYIHLHFASEPRAAANFVAACRHWGERQ